MSDISNSFVFEGVAQGLNVGQKAGEHRENVIAYKIYRGITKPDPMFKNKITKYITKFYLKFYFEYLRKLFEFLNFKIF